MPILTEMLIGLVKEVSMLVSNLVIECIPVKGKKKVSKVRLIRERKRIEKSVDNMLGKIERFLIELNPSGTEIEAGLVNRPFPVKLRDALMWLFSSYL